MRIQSSSSKKGKEYTTLFILLTKVTVLEKLPCRIIVH